MLIINKNLLKKIFEECQKTYPEEACGFVIGTNDSKRVAEQVIKCRNIQNELHQKDPRRYPRDARTAYFIDPKEMEQVQQEAKKENKSLLAIFHSHPEHDVYFSEEDKNMAAPWGEPLFPSLSYVVVSVYEGEVKKASEFYWGKDEKDFLEKKLF